VRQAWSVLAFHSVFAILGLCAFSVLAIVIDGVTDEVFKADVIVVPGNTVNADGSLSARLKARLDSALDLYQSGVSKRIFVSGAIGKEGVDEAVAMSRYLISKGVHKEDIVQDSKGYTTLDTAKNLGRYMGESSIKSAIVVTQFFHISRCKLAMKRVGISNIGAVHAKYSEARDIYSVAREVPAYASYLVPHG